MKNTELEQVQQIPSTKKEIALYASQIANALESGNVNPLDILLRFKSFEKVFEAIKPRLQELAATEASKYREKTILLLGAEFSIKESGVTYSFDNCGDTEYERRVQALESAKEAVKEREAFLKTINGHLTAVDEVTGEIVTLYPPVRKSSTGVQVSIK